MKYDNKRFKSNRKLGKKRSSSIEALQEHSMNGGLKKGKEEFLRKFDLFDIKCQSQGRNGYATRKMLSIITGFEINYVTKYVSDLIEEGVIIESDQKAKCFVTNTKAYWLKLNKVKFGKDDITN